MEKKNYQWDKMYTWVLILNAVYIILFFIVMNAFN